MLDCTQGEIMDKKFILKIKQDEKAKKMTVQTPEGKWKVFHSEYLSDVLSWTLVLLDFDEVKNELLRHSATLDNLHRLIEKGFTLRIDEIDNKYSLIISKGNCSTNFTAKKEQGIAAVLIEAEEWAEVFINDINETIINNV